MSDQRMGIEVAGSVSRERTPFPLMIDIERATAEFVSAQAEFDVEDKKDPVIFYRETISPETTYLVYRHEARWEFQLIHQDEKIAEFIFDQKADCLNMTHRLVREESKKMGINGSSFFKKAESYIRFLAQQKAIDPTKPLLIDAGQKEVVLWALKNGFRFQSEEHRELFAEATQAGSAEYLMDVDERVPTNEGIFRKGYIMKRDAYEKWRRANDEREETGQELLPAGRSSLRFHLIKALEV